MKPIELFSRDVHTCWATTYQFDLKLFDQFLLRRLGNAPLNAVVLCDEDGISDALVGLADVDIHVAASANRRYLLRGVRLPSGGRFHPKTYLLASARKTILLVGSGNLTRSGLDRGREAFTQFDAETDDSIAVLRAWASWMRDVVRRQDDEQLRRRFEHLTTSVPVLLGPSGDSSFVANLNEPILDALVRRAPEPVAELHACAPFFDERAQALREVIQRCSPKEIHLYLGARVNVDGGALRHVLESSALEVHVHGYDPSSFVHAKLIGLVGADGSGVLMCGSANLSHAALTRVYTEPGSWGNCEAVVMRSGTGDGVRAVFSPPGYAVVDVGLDDVEELTYDDDSTDLPSWTVRLRSAHVTAGRRLQLRTDSDLCACAVTWSEASVPLALDAAGVTLEAVPDDGDVVVVWLLDQAGEQCSNPVVVDDPHALEAVLGDGDGGRDLPVEIRDQDGKSELLRLLAWAHRRFIFDIEDTPALKRATNAQEQQQIDDTGFWERYAREELVSDPRSQTYRPIGTSASLTDADALLREIEAMLHAAPEDRRLRIVTGHLPGKSNGGDGTSSTWSLTARERVRARNLLRRWARALADPRHAWLSPGAPAINYEALLEVLTMIWINEALDDSDVLDLLEEVWTAFLGSNARSGLLDRAEPGLVTEVLQSLTEGARELAAALAYCALHRDVPWAGWIYDWQPFLVRGLELDIFRPGPLSIDVIEDIWAERPAVASVAETLVARAAWTDDATWGIRLAKELAISSIRLVSSAGYNRVDAAVEVGSLPAAAQDPRLITIARRVMAFKKTDHVLMVVGRERFLIRVGERCVAKINDAIHTSIHVIDDERLVAVERQQGNLADLLGIASAA